MIEEIPPLLKLRLFPTLLGDAPLDLLDGEHRLRIHEVSGDTLVDLRFVE